MALDMRYPTPLPSTKGWGPGWPNCQTGKIVQHPIFQGGLRPEIVDLVDLLVEEAKSRGFVFKPGWSWGYGCRETKGGGGGTPSFHSWGLALDINAPENVFGGAAASSDINVHNHWLVDLLATYGFFWLGPSIGDWMHFSFAGTPADAKAMTDKARKDGVGMALSPDDAKTLLRAKAFLDALIKEGGFNTVDGAGARVGKSVKATEAGGGGTPALVAHRHNEGTTGPAVPEA